MEYKFWNVWMKEMNNWKRISSIGLVAIGAVSMTVILLVLLPLANADVDTPNCLKDWFFATDRINFNCHAEIYRQNELIIQQNKQILHDLEIIKCQNLYKNTRDYVGDEPWESDLAGKPSKLIEKCGK